MYCSPSPDRFSLCSAPYLFGFSISSCIIFILYYIILLLSSSSLFLVKHYINLKLSWLSNVKKHEEPVTHLIPSVVSHEMEPTMPFWWNLRSIVARLWGIFNPPVSSYILKAQLDWQQKSWCVDEWSTNQVEDGTNQCLHSWKDNRSLEHYNTMWCRLKDR